MATNTKARQHLLTAKIGVVSSIGVPVPVRTLFENNVKLSVAPGLTFDWRPNLGFPAANIQAEIQNLVTAGAGLIITVGGLVAYNAANTSTATPLKFLSLVGDVPASPSNNCYGGLSLESFANNETRVNYLIRKGFTANNSISLYYNPNSFMAPQETQAWQTLATHHPQMVATPVAAMQSTTNNLADFATTASSITSPAVIVSADPFFQHSKDALIDALNTNVADGGTQNRVCYPLYNYRNEGVGHKQPRATKTTLLGPKLEDVVVTMAKMAAIVLNNSVKVGFLKEGLGPEIEI